MKILSADIESYKAGTLSSLCLFSKKNGVISLLSSFGYDSDVLTELKGTCKHVLISSSCDFSAETVFAPAALKGSSLELFIKSKLSASGKSVKIFKNTSVNSSTNQNVYQVYSIPEKAFEKDRRNIGIKPDFYTAASVALCAISSASFPDKTVFHAYCDEVKTIMTVSKGGLLLYSRLLPVAESLQLELDMTLTHVSKNLSIEPELIMLSGLLANEEIRSAQKIQAVISSPAGLLEDCNKTTFQSIILNFGAVLCGNELDFTPSKYIRERTFSRILLTANISLLALLFALSFFNVFSFSKYRIKTEEVSALSTEIRQDRVKAAKILSETPSADYLLSYLQLLNERDKTPLKNLHQIEPLVAITGFERIIISRSEPLTIVASVVFDNLTALTEYEQKITDQITQLTKNGWEIINESKINYEALNASVKLLLTHEEGAE